MAGVIEVDTSPLAEIIERGAMGADTQPSVQVGLDQRWCDLGFVRVRFPTGELSSVRIKTGKEEVKNTFCKRIAVRPCFTVQHHVLPPPHGSCDRATAGT
jgi:hypothetical protein